MHRLTVEEFRNSQKMPLTVVLDNVRSQNNIGSVFRTADAFRVEHIALCGICSTPPHREIHKTALGAEESVEWSYYEDTIDCVTKYKNQGYRIFAVELAWESVKLGSPDFHPFGNSGEGKSQEESPSKVVLVFGNEVDGVQESVMDLCDGFIEIPQSGTKHSLNVSCAAAIVMWEMFKEFKKLF